MKTPQFLKAQIADLLSQGEALRPRIANAELKADRSRLQREEKRLGAQMEFYKTCLLYVETEPNAAFLEKERSRLERSMEDIDTEENLRTYIGFQSHVKRQADGSLSGSELAKWQAKYRKERFYDKFKTQLEALNFLLD